MNLPFLITLKNVSNIPVLIVRFDQEFDQGAILTLSSEMLRDPGSWQMITKGEGIGPLISTSLMVLKVPFEL